jgi:hypothetical protein
MGRTVGKGAGLYGTYVPLLIIAIIAISTRQVGMLCDGGC